MFRELSRKNKALSQELCIRLLKEEMRGVLSLLGDDGYPYGLPIDHWYNEEDGCLYFHSGPSGHKIDAIGRCSKASFCVCDQGYREAGELAVELQLIGRLTGMHIAKMPFQRAAADIQIHHRQILACSPGDFMDIPGGILGKAIADRQNIHTCTS